MNIPAALDVTLPSISTLIAHPDDLNVSVFGRARTR